jgi:hypothetical protein
LAPVCVGLSENVDWPLWRGFEVDGETYYWTAYPSKKRTGEGPWEPVEYLTVSRRPESPGVGQAFPAGEAVTEQHAVGLVRRFKDNGREIPDVPE